MKYATKSVFALTLFLSLLAAGYAVMVNSESAQVDRAWQSYSAKSPSHAFVERHFRPCIEAIVTEPKFVSAGAAGLCTRLTINVADVLKAPAGVAPALDDWISARREFGYL